MHMSRAPIDPTARIATDVATMLSALGIVTSDTRDDLERVCLEELTARGHVADVVGVRYGVVTVRCAPGPAGLLRWDVDSILAAIQARTSEPVRRIVIHTR
jgi:hypothetical protein